MFDFKPTSKAQEIYKEKQFATNSYNVKGVIKESLQQNL